MEHRMMPRQHRCRRPLPGIADMKTKLLGISLLGMLWLAPLASAQAVIVVIAHPSVQTSALTADQVSQLFMGRASQLPDGTAVKALDLGEGSPVRAQFIDRTLGKTEAQLRSYWSRMIFTGKAQPPRVMKNTAEMLRAVASTPGYIGYVDGKDATSDRVKVLYRAD